MNLFLILDDKKDCIGVYHQGQLLFGEKPLALTHTWDYSPSHNNNNNNYEYARFYCNGLTLDEACPSSLRVTWKKKNDKMRAMIGSIAMAKMSLSEHCIYDLIPQHFLASYCDTKLEIVESVFERYDKPQIHNHFLSIAKLTKDIALRKVNFNEQASILSSQKEFSAFAARVKGKKTVNYNMFKAITGRLTTSPESFPIMNMSSEFRSAILPTNDFFVEIDFNSAELRCFLGLLGEEQPEEDLHEWNDKQLFNSKYVGDRDELKKRMFSWFYNPEAVDKELEKVYNRSKLLEEFWRNGKIETIFGRSIEADRHHALNYLLQSTTSDLFLENAAKTFETLNSEGSGSFVAFLVHDSVVLDIKKEDVKILPKIFSQMRETRLGKFKISIKKGFDYGNMIDL